MHISRPTRSKLPANKQARPERQEVTSPELVARIDALLLREHRVMLGITGSPGSGKTELAASVVAAAINNGVPAVYVPMDGFHLADVELRRLGRLGRKGAINTFDGYGYLAVLERIRSQPDHIVYTPAFDREIERPLAGSVAVFPDTRLVVTEGNYLLDDDEPWHSIRGLLSEVWFVDTNVEERHRRLVNRHRQFGKSAAEAEAWVREVDEPNAQRIEAVRHKADLLVN
jgi:pantothenate kinase